MSEIVRVAFTLNGSTHDLTYNNTEDRWEGSITAPTTTSWNNTDHVYTGSVTVYDEAGNSTTVDSTDINFGEALKLRVKEIIKPVATITYPTTGAYIDLTNPTITATLTDEALGSGINTDSVILTIDGTPISNSALTFTPLGGVQNGYTMTYTVPVPNPLPEGPHTITVTATDNDDNVSDTDSSTFNVLTSQPILNVTYPNEDILTNQNTITVTGITDPATPGLTVEIFIGAVSQGNATIEADGSFSHEINLAEGENTIRIVATNAAGVETSVTRIVTVDTMSPTVTSITLTPNPANTGVTLTIRVTATDN